MQRRASASSSLVSLTVIVTDSLSPTVAPQNASIGIKPNDTAGSSSQQLQSLTVYFRTGSVVLQG